MEKLVFQFSIHLKLSMDDLPLNSLYRKNVLDSVHKAVFKKPICEVLLDQKFFNGVGNYLRAEILYR